MAPVTFEGRNSRVSFATQDEICNDTNDKNEEVTVTKPRNPNPLPLFNEKTTWNGLLRPTIDSIGSRKTVMHMQLDSHANMVVLGKHCYIIAKQDDKCEVSAFVGDVGTLKSVDVVDACLAYDCIKTSRTILLVFRNALYIPNMKHHLIPPFILREADVKVFDKCKIHCDEIDLDSHSIWFKEAYFQHLKQENQQRMRFFILQRRTPDTALQTLINGIHTQNTGKRMRRAI